jgi:hypothetical protein
MSPKIIKHITWHQSYDVVDGVMVHPSNDKAWKHFNSVTTPIFLHSFLQYIGNFQIIFFYIYIQVPPKFLPKFQQSLPYTGRSQFIDIYPVYTSNISHLITQNHDLIILGLNPTHSHQHNTSYSITSYNVVQIKDSISTINMHGQKGTKSFNH